MICKNITERVVEKDHSNQGILKLGRQKSNNPSMATHLRNFQVESKSSGSRYQKSQRRQAVRRPYNATTYSLCVGASTRSNDIRGAFAVSGTTFAGEAFGPGEVPDLSP